jgi:ornithine cyclodeaminase/alanine dehydrogenase-like protein (mu-crystallin family)
MAEKYGIEAKACDTAEEIYRGADITAALTDSAVLIVNGPLLEKGTHLVAPGTGDGIKDRAVLDRIDVYMRFGNATTPWGADERGVDDEYYTYAARPDVDTGFKRKIPGRRGHGAMFARERTTTYLDIVNGVAKGRTSPDQISYSERGNLQGNQFWPLAGRVYELAKARGIGREIPTEWFLQDIRN